MLVERTLGVQPRQQQQDLRPIGPSGAIRSRCATSASRRRGPRPAGTTRRNPGWWSAGAQFVAGVGDEPAHPSSSCGPLGGQVRRRHRRWICVSMPFSAGDNGRPRYVDHVVAHGVQLPAAIAAAVSTSTFVQRPQAAVHHRTYPTTRAPAAPAAPMPTSATRPTTAPWTPRRTGRSRRWSARLPGRAPRPPATSRANRSSNRPSSAPGRRRCRRQIRLGVAVVDGDPHLTVGVDAPHIEVRRRRPGLGHLVGRRQRPPRRLRPTVGRVDEGSGRRG